MATTRSTPKKPNAKKAAAQAKAAAAKKKAAEKARAAAAKKAAAAKAKAAAAKKKAAARAKAAAAKKKAAARAKAAAAKKKAAAKAKAAAAKKKAAAKAKAAAKKKAAKRYRYTPNPWVPQAPALEKSVTYRFGRWTIVASQPHNHDVVMWTEGAETAIELVSGSNGWWHFLKDAKEYVVWPYGGASDQALFAHPWIDRKDSETREIAPDARFEAWNGDYGTRLAFEETELRVTLHDGRVLTIPRDSTEIVYDGRVGERILTSAN